MLLLSIVKWWLAPLSIYQAGSPRTPGWKIGDDVLLARKAVGLEENICWVGNDGLDYSGGWGKRYYGKEGRNLVYVGSWLSVLHVCVD